MAHKIITLITTLVAIFTTTIPMDQVNIDTKKDPKNEQPSKSPLSQEENNIKLILNTLYDCGQITKKMEKNIDILFDKINMQDRKLDNYNLNVQESNKEIEFIQNDIKDLQNSSKNNNQHVNILEVSINHITDSLQQLTQHMQDLNSNISKNYVTKEEASSCQEQFNRSLDAVKKKLNLFLEEKPRSTSSYKQYLLKIAPPATIIMCIAIFYKIRKPLQKKMNATLKKIRSFFSRKKIIDLF